MSTRERVPDPNSRSIASPANQLLSRVVDGGIVATVSIAPLFMGGRHPLGKLVFAAICWLVGFAWFLSQTLRRKSSWNWSGAELIVLLGLVVLLAQLLPVSQQLQQGLSPAQSELLPAKFDATETGRLLGSSSTVSLAPEQTRQGVCLYLGYSLLFLVVFQRLRTLDDIEWLLTWIAISAAGMACLGLAQYLVGNGKFLWVYEHPTRNTHFTVKGAFANQNHFAHFLALGIGPLIWLRDLVHRRRAKAGSRVSRHDVFLQMCVNGAIGAVLLAGVLTFSRGGWLILSFSTLICIGLFAYHSLIDKKTVGFIGVLFAVTAMALTIHGRERLQSRLETLATTSIEQLDSSRARRKIWTAVSAAIPEFARLGSGVGSHREVYPTYMKDWSEVEYSHAESGYLQVLLETGAPGFVLLLLAVGLSGYWTWSSLRLATTQRAKLCATVLVACWSASIVHSTIDFVWYIPACMSCTLLLIAAAGRLYMLLKSDGKSLAADGASQAADWNLTPTRMQWAVATAVLAVVGVSSLRTQVRPALAQPHWENYLAKSFAGQEAAKQAELQTQATLAGTFSLDRLNSMAASLERTLEADPYHARAHLRLATTCLRQFEIRQQSGDNPMGLAAIREAAIASRFPSSAAQMKWLRLATGDNVELLTQAFAHARAAVQLCPMHGEAYLHLADLSFLAGFVNSRSALYDQAMAVRPYQGIVLYAVGIENLANGDVDTASALLKQAFRRDPELQDTIIAAVAPVIPAEAFVTVFEPDARGLGKLFAYYRKLNAVEHAAYAGEQYALVLQQGVEKLNRIPAAQRWDEIERVYGVLQQLPQALNAARKSVAANPNAFHARYRLAIRLEQSGLIAEALEHYRWCQRRRPSDEPLRTKLAELAGSSTLMR